jgi:hypothetical protein
MPLNLDNNLEGPIIMWTQVPRTYAAKIICNSANDSSPSSFHLLEKARRILQSMYRYRNVPRYLNQIPAGNKLGRALSLTAKPISRQQEI